MAPKSVSATVKYHKPGTTPPVYLAGSFSEPVWQPKEMEHTVAEDNELDFHSEVQVEEGREYQYKFRIGDGDWWVLNEDSPSGTLSLSKSRSDSRADAVSGSIQLLLLFPIFSSLTQFDQAPTTLGIETTFSLRQFRNLL